MTGLKPLITVDKSMWCLSILQRPLTLGITPFFWLSYTSMELVVVFWRDYLTNYQQRIIVKGEVSDWLTITSGVPWGSLLGRLFFFYFSFIYINDFPRVISKDSSIALYADDSKLYRIINSLEDMSSFQGDLDKISDWVRTIKWKCKIMRITGKKSPLARDYYINDHYIYED